MAGVLIFGIVGYRLLPVSDLPNVDYPVISVSANLPGASPETMASAVATPLEKQFSTISGLDAMTSSSSLGSTSITLQFALDRDIDAAAQDVQAAITKTLRSLPTGITPPSYQKVNPADSPILFLVLTSKMLSLSQLDDYAENALAQRISMVNGVAQVSVFGAQKYAVRIQLDPRALSSRGIAIGQVSDAIQSANVNLPTGILWGKNRSSTVVAGGQLQNAQETWSWPSARAPPCGSAIWAKSGTTSRTTGSRAGTGISAASRSRSSGSPGRTPSRSRTPSTTSWSASGPSSQRPSRSITSTTDPSPSGTPCRTCNSRSS
jgi:multidrug efflux pump subunit AcrB